MKIEVLAIVWTYELAWPIGRPGFSGGIRAEIMLGSSSPAPARNVGFLRSSAANLGNRVCQRGRIARENHPFLRREE